MATGPNGPVGLTDDELIAGFDQVSRIVEKTETLTEEELQAVTFVVINGVALILPLISHESHDEFSRTLFQARQTLHRHCQLDLDPEESQLDQDPEV